MRRSRAVDRALLVAWLAAYLVLLAVVSRENLRHEAWFVPFGLAGAQSSSGQPLVVGEGGLDCPVQKGDRLIRVEEVQLRGRSKFEIALVLAPRLRSGEAVELGLERDGSLVTARCRGIANRYWWVPLSVFASFTIAGGFLLLRAPHWHLSRRFFLLSALWSCIGTTGESPSPLLDLVRWSVFPLAVALTVACLFEWSAAARPLRPWMRVLPWVAGVVEAVLIAGEHLLTLPVGGAPDRLRLVTQSVYLTLALAGLSRAYVRAGALERRQLRWVIYGAYLGLLPNVLFLALAGVLGAWGSGLLSSSVTASLAAFPIGIAVSVVGYRWLDVDRLISATASLTILGSAALGVAFVLVPRLAYSTSAALGIDSETGQLVLSMALAAVLVPAYRALRPWLDRRLFAERYERIERSERLRRELSGCEALEALARTAGEGIDALLRPESIATYARAGEAFTPVFVRGHAAPPAFEAKSALVQVLEAKGAPLSGRWKKLSPFERAALETLGAEVVVPVKRGQQLVAFICLADKRSGDIYTPTDLTLLAALAEGCSGVIARLDAEAVAREAQAMQLALRRYVPGAVAERLLRGDALEPAEREVSVLFVDIRDYTRVTSGLRPADVFATLNEHTERVSGIVQECGGTIVEFNGDGMMAVFGAPEALPRKEQQAALAARRIVDSMPATLAVGVGIATGEAFVGSIRSTDRLIWSAVGSTTNLASRLQSMTRELSASIAIDETTRERAGYVCENFVRHADVAIRGRSGRFDVFALQLTSENAAG